MCIRDSYWKTQEATVDGMLGGYGRVTGIDLASSWKFISTAAGKKSFRGQDGGSRAIDMGAGIGRITEGLLMRICNEVDILEQNDKYVEVAKEKLGGKTNGEFICCGIQSWKPAPGRLYDIIWVQWVSLYLTDDHFVEFLNKCIGALAPGGLVYVKDNASGVETFLLDSDDNSVCRSDAMYRAVFERAGWNVVEDAIQEHFPEELYEVRMYALAPPSMP
eukprot:TRINITY_DN299_c0_g1_i2.p1 TRINITY_DN299_c0_g1~~TRINITY_DN299_c0_g1_i2.p1  ORF type:complete len:219 (+),score=57.11 TRINITY_DN299_c0_g1_i2:83-739(+)